MAINKMLSKNKTSQLFNKDSVNNFLHALLALLCAFGIWQTLSVTTKIYATVPVTVVFFNTKNRIIQAPETIYLDMYAKRSVIKNMLYTTTLHIDAAKYTPGTHTIQMHNNKEQFLSIPDDAVMIHCSDLVITVEFVKQSLPQENVQCTDHFSEQMVSEPLLENHL